MRLRSLITLPIAAIALAACQQAPAQDEAADRAEIHALLTAYGSTLDTRDFDGFAALFAEDGTYNGTSGAQAGEMMRGVFAENALGIREPNFHVFFNEVITLDGPDEAHATSMSFYVAPDAENRPQPILMASYDDQLVRENGDWKFANRTVNSLIPAPAPPAAENAAAE